MAAEIIISGVSALLQAVDLWITLRDRRAAVAAFKETFPQISRDRDLQRQARTLESMVPAPVLEAMKDRVERCWSRYKDVLEDEDGYLPGEVDGATEALKKCICRELRRIRDLNGSIPAGKLQDWWTLYCSPA